MDVMVQCWIIFCKSGCSGKDYVEGFNFRVQFIKDVKSVKKFKEAKKYLFLLPFFTIFV